MPWVVGIDEAGYGPNLGPLVQAAVALRLPDDDPAGWETLKPWVRRCHERADDRLLIDDSKKVYAQPGGLAKLERAVLAGLGHVTPVTFTGLLPTVAPELADEVWFRPDHPMPLSGEFHPTRPPVGPMLARLTPAAGFNRVLDADGSKAAPLARGLIAFLQDVPGRLPDEEPVLFLCDKLGGRNFYGPMLAAAFPDGWVVPLKESAAESRYRIDGLAREVTVVFRPKADGDSVSVALASMLCKYLREVCMMQFNAFWATHVPGLKPTAGYPVDAKRFYAEIRPAMERLGIEADAVWRKK